MTNYAQLTPEETVWLKRFHDHLISRGLEPQEALGISPPIELGEDPEECANEEIYCMAQDAD